MDVLGDFDTVLHTAAPLVAGPHAVAETRPLPAETPATARGATEGQVAPGGRRGPFEGRLGGQGEPWGSQVARSFTESGLGEQAT